MPVPLPHFRYHPDPLKTGSIFASDNVCRCCGKARGYIYAEAPYTEQDVPEDSLCPWCIADGSAHKEFAAEFIDLEGISADLPEAVAKELLERTPGYPSWQGEVWPGCCGDAAAYLGPYGKTEIHQGHSRGEILKQPLLDYIQESLGYEGAAATLLLDRLDRDKGPTAHLFECLHCGKRTFHIDFP